MPTLETLSPVVRTTSAGNGNGDDNGAAPDNDPGGDDSSSTYDGDSAPLRKSIEGKALRVAYRPQVAARANVDLETESSDKLDGKCALCSLRIGGLPANLFTRPVDSTTLEEQAQFAQNNICRIEEEARQLAAELRFARRALARIQQQIQDRR